MKKVFLLIFFLCILLSCGMDDNIKVIIQGDISNASIEKTMENKDWIYPGKLEISLPSDNNSVEWNLRIHNGKSSTGKFSVYLRDPNYVEDGFERLEDWSCVDISNKLLIIDPGKTEETTIMVNAKNFKNKQEFWIAVVDESQSDMIRAELCSRWLIVKKNGK